MMKDIPGMTVKEHHELTIGVLACCYQHVPADLKRAIMEACESAKQMGMNIKPERLNTGEPLHASIASNDELSHRHSEK